MSRPRRLVLLCCQRLAHVTPHPTVFSPDRNEFQSFMRGWVMGQYVRNKALLGIIMGWTFRGGGLCERFLYKVESHRHMNHSIRSCSLISSNWQGDHIDIHAQHVSINPSVHCVSSSWIVYQRKLTSAPSCSCFTVTLSCSFTLVFSCEEVFTLWATVRLLISV